MTDLKRITGSAAGSRIARMLLWRWFQGGPRSRHPGLRPATMANFLRLHLFRITWSRARRAPGARFFFATRVFRLRRRPLAFQRLLFLRERPAVVLQTAQARNRLWMARALMSRSLRWRRIWLRPRRLRMARAKFTGRRPVRARFPRRERAVARRQQLPPRPPPSLSPFLRTA